MLLGKYIDGPIVYRLGHRVFIPVSGVRLSVGSQTKKEGFILLFLFIISWLELGTASVASLVLPPRDIEIAGDAGV